MTRAIHGNALFYKAGALKKSHIYDVLAERDVVLPPMTSSGFKVVKAKRTGEPEHIRLTLEYALPPDLSPRTNDVSWTLPDGDSDLTDIILLLGYRQGALKQYSQHTWRIGIEKTASGPYGKYARFDAETDGYVKELRTEIAMLDRQIAGLKARREEAMKLMLDQYVDEV